MRIKKKTGMRDAGVMSGVKLACALAAGILLLSACGKGSDKHTENAEIESGTDAPASDFEYPFVAKSENGYYFWERISSDRLNPRLMFMDKESGQALPLCNRPDCTHETIECNAYFREHDNDGGGVHKRYLQYYEENLYAIGLSEDAYVSLFRIRADGSAEWEISAKLYRTDYDSTHQWESPEVLIADGYIYFVDWYQKIKKLERMPIAGGTSEVLFEEDSDAVGVHIFRLECEEDGGRVFFQTVAFLDESLEHSQGGLYQCDTATGQCSLLKSGLTSPYTVWNGAVYYANTDGLCRYSIQNETTEILVDQPMEVPNITLTKDYIVLCHQMEDYALTFYDYEGNEAATVPNMLGLGWYFGGDSEMLFGECWNDDITLCFLDLTRPMQDWQWEELKENG